MRGELALEVFAPELTDSLSLRLVLRQLSLLLKHDHGVDMVRTDFFGDLARHRLRSRVQLPDRLRLLGDEGGPLSARMRHVSPRRLRYARLDIACVGARRSLGWAAAGAGLGVSIRLAPFFALHY